MATKPPGPIMLHGEETRVEFRNISISVLAGQALGPSR